MVLATLNKVQLLVKKWNPQQFLDRHLPVSPPVQVLVVSQLSGSEVQL